MTRILDGKATASAIRREVADEVEELVGSGGRPPGLAAVLVGEDPASEIYVRNKARACREVGIVGRTIHRPEDTTQEDLLDLVEELNEDPAVDGILVQLPLPEGLDERSVIEEIDPSKDVDGFHPVNVGRLWLGEPGFVSATPGGIMELLRRYDVELEGMNTVVLGRSNIVGKPMAGLLIRSHATVTVCHSRTRELADVCRRADLLVAAVGRPGFVGPDQVKEGAVVVDVGINRLRSEEEVTELFGEDEEKLDKVREKGSVLVGDVDFDRVAPKAAAITPVPGGVGPLTIAMLLENTLRAGRLRQGETP
ncbi:MAG: bifunctional methylenetetrahydrofolate dehydrogenase/methenyltetrahydrofolate cyclohydrolase FolD [Thermoanaerobaculia bacterium]|nr:bifunctional methylenetetrahydrofolate dehydrogenase/methenyltetrahydrofolate cyclohydrolase FolD [Thermoanaerobaculia bacterium]